MKSFLLYSTCEPDVVVIFFKNFYIEVLLLRNAVFLLWNQLFIVSQNKIQFAKNTVTVSNHV